MNSPTDITPEAREAKSKLFDAKWDGNEYEKVISQACLAYHKRRLAECGGDAGELALEVKKLSAQYASGEPYITKTVELLQLHAAKAVEEATKDLLAMKAHQCHCLEQPEARHRAAVAKFGSRVLSTNFHWVTIFHCRCGGECAGDDEIHFCYNPECPDYLKECDNDRN